MLWGNPTNLDGGAVTKACPPSKTSPHQQNARPLEDGRASREAGCEFSATRNE